jgi:site-specific DNA recombinase
VTVFGYARISSATQEDNTSISVQRERILAYAKAHALEAPTIIAETGSGADADRAGLSDLRQRLQPGDTLVVLRLDRLFRSVVDGLPFFRDTEARGIAIRSVTENLDTGSPMGRLMLTMVLAFATAERELIAERMASGKKRNAETGKFNGGPVPFGYVRTPDGPNDFEPDPLGATVVRELFRRYSTGCVGLRELKAATQCALSESAIAELLANPFYLGRVRYRGTVRPNAHVPLVSRRTFRLVQGALASRRKNRGNAAEILRTSNRDCPQC